MTRVKATKLVKPPDDPVLSGHIRRQAGDHATRRFLRSLPTFRVVSDLPDHLRQLLDRLERAENGQGSRG